MYELNSDGEQIKYGLRKDGLDYLVDKEDIPQTSLIYSIITSKIENSSPNGEIDVLYITGEDMKCRSIKYLKMSLSSKKVIYL